METKFSYPVNSCISFGKTLYEYKCCLCERIIGGYYHKRVKGKIICPSCRSEMAKSKYRERQKETWRSSIAEN